RLPGPLVVCPAFIMKHAIECIEFSREGSRQSGVAKKMDKHYKRSPPRLYDNKPPPTFQYPSHLRKGLVQVTWQHWQVMKTTLNDNYIFGIRIKRKAAAVAKIPICRP